MLRLLHLTVSRAFIVANRQKIVGIQILCVFLLLLLLRYISKLQYALASVRAADTNSHTSTQSYAVHSLSFSTSDARRLPSLPSLLPTSKSAHDKQYIDKKRRQTYNRMKRRKKQQHNITQESNEAASANISTVVLSDAPFNRKPTKQIISQFAFIVKEHTSKGKYSEHQLSLSLAR